MILTFKICQIYLTVLALTYYFLSKMDKEDSLNLDVEFNQYLQILRPYLDQLLNEEDIKICNTWIRRLTECKEGDNNLRNKYIFTLCFQLAKGVLSPPFNDYPPPNDLPMLFDKFTSDDSFSDADTHVTYSINKDCENFFNNRSSSKSMCPPKSSLNTMCSSDIKINDKVHDMKTLAHNFLSTSNSTIANCSYCPEILKDLKNYVNTEDNVYVRVTNLVDKLREIKKENIMLNKELKFLKEESTMKESLNLSSKNAILQIHCATNTGDISNKECFEQYQQCSCKKSLTDYKEKLEKFNESKRTEFEELKRKHEFELLDAQTSVRTEVQNAYEKKMRDLTEEYESKIKIIKQNTEAEINQLKVSRDEIRVDRENAIAIKDKEINDLRAELDEIKTHNYILRNTFMRTSNNMSSESMQEKALHLERRLYKTEKSKNKRIKAYQMQLACLQREKNLLESSMHLQLLKQRSELVTNLTEENQKELTGTCDKLEKKYKEVVANVQAAAIQRRMQDQMALDAIIKSIYASDNGSNNSLRDNEEELKPPKNHSKTKGAFSPLHCRNEDDVNKKIFNLEDSFITGFCLDEVKLGELFKRLHITQKEIGNDDFNDHV